MKSFFWSESLIPIPLSQLLTDSNSEIKEFCPEKFEIDISGKRKEWEGTVLLPMVNFDVVRKEYFKHIDKVDSSELDRNTLGSSFLYSYSQKTSFVFHSCYGDISSCKVTNTQIDI